MTLGVSNYEFNRFWDDLVRVPVHKAIYSYHPILKRNGMIDQVFRLQDLDVLVDRLYRRDDVSVARGT